MRELYLAVGAKIMLTVNVDVSSYGLVNGARRTMKTIINTGDQVTLVFMLV